LTPARGWDVGAGKGHAVEATLRGGTGGVILDGRGRPLELPANDRERVARLVEWGAALEAYPS
jgi:hypothetical protein